MHDLYGGLATVLPRLPSLLAHVLPVVPTVNDRLAQLLAPPCRQYWLTIAWCPVAFGPARVPQRPHTPSVTVIATGGCFAPLLSRHGPRIFRPWPGPDPSSSARKAPEHQRVVLQRARWCRGGGLRQSAEHSRGARGRASKGLPDALEHSVAFKPGPPRGSQQALLRRS